MNGDLKIFRIPRTFALGEDCTNLQLSAGALHRFLERGQKVQGEEKEEGCRSTMPRRPPRSSAVQMAHTFVHVFIAESTSDDQILPKNG